MSWKAAGRKGQADLLVHIIRIVFIVVLAFLLMVQIGFFTGMQLPSDNLEAQLIMQRILTGPAGLATHEDITGRLLTGTVDVSRLSDSDMTRIYAEGFGPDNLWGGKVTLYKTRAAIGNYSTAFKQASLNNDLATSLLPLAKAGVRGSGGGLYYSAAYPVLFKLQPDAEFQTGWLTIELVKRT